MSAAPRNRIPSGNLARPAAPRVRMDNLARAFGRHPVIAFFRHRGRIGFYRQLHAILSAGLPLPTAFAQLARYAPEPGLAAALKLVAKDVEEGATLAQAMQRHGAHFDDGNVELIAFAEEAGKLDVVLALLMAHLEDVQKLRWRAVALSLWPVYLAGILVFVGPLLGAAAHVKALDEVGAVYLWGLMRNLLWAGAAALAVFAAPLTVTALGLEVPWDTLKRRVPLLDRALRDLYAARLVLALGLSMGAGLEVVRALTLAVKATASPSLQATLPRAQAVLLEGGTLAQAIGALQLLDRASLGTLGIAEQTGRLSDALERLSGELQDASLRATRLLIGAVLFVVVAVLLFLIVGSLLEGALVPAKALLDAVGPESR